MRLFIIFAVLLASSLGFAQEAADFPVDWVPVDPVFVPPAWLESVLLSLAALPTLGPILVKVGQWAGVFAVASTTLAVSAVAILHALGAALKRADLEELAKKIEAKAKPVVYWLKYFSLFNAKKEEKK